MYPQKRAHVRVCVGTSFLETFDKLVLAPLNDRDKNVQLTRLPSHIYRQCYHFYSINKVK